MRTPIFKRIISTRHTLLYVFLCLFFVLLHAQIRPKQLRKEMLQSQVQVKPTQKGKKSRPKPAAKSAQDAKMLAPIANPLKDRNAALVYLENSETLSYDKVLRPDVQMLKGSVKFRHGNTVMFCDSAYFYEGANSLDAFGNVRIVQGDTLFVYGDILYYDGNIKLARMRHNVKMVNRRTTLTTDSLNYDRAANLAYYYTGGRIVDDVNTLTSIWGQYSPSTNEALFKNKVNLVNKNFTMESDTLKYNTKTSVANIVGPTHILYNKETDIYTNRGWYNTSTERMMLLDRSLIKQKDGKSMVGDTIFYDKKLKFAEGFKWVVLNDTVQKATLVGNYVNYNEILKKGMATDSAMLVDWSSKDTMYVHADTLYTYKDSIYDAAKGINNVRIFRFDVQGLCDSLLYSARDSVLNMHGEPVLWKDNNQLSGESIQAFTKNQKVVKVDIKKSAMAIQQQDSIYFNQLSGKEIIAHLDSGQLKRVNVNGNAETIYYPVDDKDSTIVGINKTQSSFVVLYMKNKKVDRIVMTSASNGNMYPLGQLSGADLLLKNYKWLDEQRPKKKEDVLTIFPKNGAKTDTGKDAKKNTKDLKPSQEEKKEAPPTTDKKKNSKKKAKK